jgi:hypothetical protein
MKAPSLFITEFPEEAVWAWASARHHLQADHHEWVLL